MGLSAGYTAYAPVETTTDLTQYHPAWTAGSLGVIVPDCTPYARAYDRFLSVRFDDPIGTRDVLAGSLRFLAVPSPEPAPLSLIECLHCGERVTDQGDPRGMDAADWRQAEYEHAQGCEWVIARAHTQLADTP